MEFSGKLASIDVGYNFALSQVTLDINGEQEVFRFNPTFGKFFLERIKIGDELSVRVNVNPRSRGLLKKRPGSNRSPAFLGREPIVQIKIDNQWLEVPNEEKRPQELKIFIDKKIVGKYTMIGVDKAIIFENGLIGFNYWSMNFPDSKISLENGSRISFFGYRMKYKDGYQYPIDGVRDVYWLNLLQEQTAELHSFLFKQDHVCIGVKFKKPDGTELMVSFPAEKAQRVHSFLKPDHELKIYYSPEFNLKTKYELPELHAVIQGSDTLFIEEFGFFGDADGKHEHTDVELKGKITRINKSDKGNVMSIIVGSEYYVEINAMMAEQLGLFFEKGKEIIVAGKERVKKKGEIYSKDYRIVSPEKIAVDGKTFELYHP
ncbi:MAG: hypothetical protein QM734_03675 [Cyclobacteriaceae bacterium]